MMNHLTPSELEEFVGEEIKRMRLNMNLTQQMLADRADISRRALQKLESGEGSTLHSLVSVLRALKRANALKALAPIPTINPLTMLESGQRRQRATPKDRKAIRMG